MALCATPITCCFLHVHADDQREAGLYAQTRSKAQEVDATMVRAEREGTQVLLQGVSP